MALGSDYSLFVMSDGSVWGMGDNGLGALGLTNYYWGVSQPVQIPLTNVVAIAAGFGHSLFLKSDGSLWGVGDDTSGQLGDGAYYSEIPQGPRQPEQIVCSGVTKIAAGFSFSLFLKSDGSLWAMGDNTFGELGDGTPLDSGSIIQTNLPEEIVASNVTAIAAGVIHSLFLKSDGSLWGMGYNRNGQLGDGTYATAIRPELIVASNVTAIAAGGYHSLFLKSDGSLWAMGDDSYGQLGDGNYNGVATPWLNTNQPEEIVASNVTAIAAGQYHSLFIKSDGSLWAMGDNFYGELGDGFTDYNPLPSTSIPEQVFPPPPPVLVEAISSNTNLQFTATCGFGGNFQLLASTNLTQPLCQWTPVWTNAIIYRYANIFSATLTNVVNSASQQFFILQSQ
jgi:alpha-tubulin suppressor-like RCC1 family protein